MQVTAEQCEEDTTVMTLRLSGAAAPGLVWLEVQRGVMLSSAVPLLVLPAGHDDLAAEVLRIVSSPAKQEAPAESQSRCCDGFLADLGLVLSQTAASPGPSGNAWEQPPQQLTHTAVHQVRMRGF